MRKLKGLEAAISVNVVDWVLTPDGWKFNEKVSVAFLPRLDAFRPEASWSGALRSSMFRSGALRSSMFRSGVIELGLHDTMSSPR